MTLTISPVDNSIINVNFTSLSRFISQKIFLRADAFDAKTICTIILSVQMMNSRNNTSHDLFFLLFISCHRLSSLTSKQYFDDQSFICWEEDMIVNFSSRDIDRLTSNIYLNCTCYIDNGHELSWEIIIHQD